MMIFGIGTQTDNALGAAKVLTVDANGNLSTIYRQPDLRRQLHRLGINGIFFLDTKTTGLPVCRTAPTSIVRPRCSRSRRRFAASTARRAPSPSTSATSTRSTGRFNAFSEVAGPNPGGFAWGLSFFFGRTIFTAIEGQATPGGTGPYFAF